MEQFSDYGIEIPYRRTTGQVKCKCPKCSATRTNKHDRSLSVNLDSGVWHCHYCNWSGTLNSYEKRVFKAKKKYIKPQDKQQANYSAKMISYFISRGISESVMKMCRIGEDIEDMPPAKESTSDKWRKINTIQFRYYLEDELINIKYRTADKVFKLVTGAELIPYNINSIKDKSKCIITEGEFDCLSFVEAGFKSCVSVPNGANANLSYLDEVYDGWFDDKETIYIASDSDTKGLKLRDELVRRFGAERCKIITYGDGCKDANEHLMKYGRESLIDCVNNATDVPVEGIFTVRDFRDKFIERYKKGLVGGVSVGLSNLDRCITWETKRLCVVSGYPSGGKSAFINDLILRLNLLYGWKTVFFSPESFPLEDHAAVLSEWIVGKHFHSQVMSMEEVEEVYDYLADNISMIMPSDGNRLDYILERADIEIKRKGVKIVVVDPYNTIESQQGNKSETLYISEVLDKITNFARKRDVLFILAAHPSKSTNGMTYKDVPTLGQISGSIHFWNKADYGLIVHRYKDNEDEKQNYTLVDIQKVKDKRLGNGGKVCFKYNPKNRRYVVYDPQDPNSLNVDSWDNRNYLHDDISEPYKAKSSTEPIYSYQPQQSDTELLDAINEFENGLNSTAPF